jgi:hypothetical protein
MNVCANKLAESQKPTKMLSQKLSEPTSFLQWPRNLNCTGTIKNKASAYMIDNAGLLAKVK